MLRKASDGAAWPCAAPLRGHTIVVQAHWCHRRGTSVKWHERQGDAVVTQPWRSCRNLDQSGICINPSKPAGPFPLKYRCRPGQGSRETDANGAERVHGTAARRFELLLLLPMLLSPSGWCVRITNLRTGSFVDAASQCFWAGPKRATCHGFIISSLFLFFCQCYSVTIWCVRIDSVRTDGLVMPTRGCGRQVVPV